MKLYSFVTLPLPPPPSAESTHFSYYRKWQRIQILNFKGFNFFFIVLKPEAVLSYCGGKIKYFVELNHCFSGIVLGTVLADSREVTKQAKVKEGKWLSPLTGQNAMWSFTIKHLIIFQRNDYINTSFIHLSKVLIKKFGWVVFYKDTICY